MPSSGTNKRKLNKKSLGGHFAHFIAQTLDLIFNLGLGTNKQCKGSGSLDPQHFGFLDPYSQKYANPRIRIQGSKLQKINAKKSFAFKT